MTYIALLRGINVGGNNKVSMAQLAHSFEQAGMTGVRTYINSGNIIFNSNETDIARLTIALEKVIETTFGFAVKVLVWDKPHFLELNNALPQEWRNDTEMKCDVMFLWEDIDTPAILEQLTIKPDIDRVMYVPGAILWSVDRDEVTKSGMLKLVGTPLYARMTIRNCNTLRKLAALLQG